MTIDRMSAEERRVIDLLDLSCDGRLSAAGADELHELIHKDFLYFQACVQYFDMHSELVLYAMAPLTPDDLSEFISRGPLPERRRGRKMLSISVATAVLCLFVLCGLTLFLKDLEVPLAVQSQPNHTVPSHAEPVSLARIHSISPHVAWAGHAREPDAMLYGQDQIQLAQGRILIEFKSGVQLQLQGPGGLQMDSSNSVRLFHGQAMAYVPPAGSGFTIRTGDMVMVDYGTEFLVNATQDRQTTVSVRQGQVGVGFQSGTGAEQRSLTAGTAATLDEQSKQVHKAKYEADQFIPFDLDRAGIASISGRVRYVLGPRPTFPINFQTPVNETFLLKEVANSRLTAPLEINDLVGSVKIDQSTVLDSFLIHFSPNGKPTSRTQGTITFEEEILGVITDGDSLGLTDELLSLRPVNQNEKSRGLDNNSDRVQLSADRHTLTFNILTAEGFTDQIRVLVKPAGVRHVVAP